MSTPDTDFVETIVNYTTPTGGGIVFRRAAGETEHGVSTPQPVQVYNARRSNSTLEREGFTLVDHIFEAFDPTNEKQIRTKYYPEIEQLAKQVSHASLAIAFEHNIRTSEPVHVGEKRPVQHVHADWIANNVLPTAKEILRTAHKPSKLLSGRFIFMNAWHPFTPVLKDPLAVCDAQSVDPLDCVPTKLPNKKNYPTIYSFRYNPIHRWWYFPHMMPNETLFFKHFDSITGQIVPHTSFLDPTSDPHAPARQSIEVRLLILF